MGMFTVLSKKEQVAEAVRRRIREGRMPAGTRLESVRNLADAFNVSAKVVVDAFDILEGERFIRRGPGRGVFVRGRGAAALEVGVLGFGVDLANNEYFRRLAMIATPPNLREGFNFTVRTVSTPEDVSDQAFSDELARLGDALRADCMLLNAPLLGRMRVELCLKQHIPTIFVGDFSEGEHQGLEYHQIAGDNRGYGQLCLRQLLLAERPAAATLFIGSRERFFFREFHRGAQEAADAAGVELHLVELPKGISSSIPESERGAIYQDKAAAARLDCPALNGGLPEERLLQTFAALGTRPPALYHCEMPQDHHRKFHDAIYRKIQEVVAEPRRFERTILCPESVILRRSI